MHGAFICVLFFDTAFYNMLAHALSIKLNIHGILFHLAVFLIAHWSNGFWTEDFYK